MRYIKELIIAALVLALFWSLWTAQGERTRLKTFEVTEGKLKASLDSLTTLQHKADLEALKALTELAKAKSAIQAQTLINERLKTRYNALKSMAPRNLTDSAINAEISRLYPVR